MMSDKEIVVYLVLVREQLDKGNAETVRTLLNEKIKRLGFKLSGELITNGDSDEKKVIKS